MSLRLVRRSLIVLLSMLAVWTGPLAGASPAVLDFVRPGLDGQPVRLSDYRGQWVVVNFWATWCGPCIKEIPELEHFHREHDQATVIGVNFETIDAASLQRFLNGFDITYPIVVVGHEPLLPFEPLKGLPSTFVVSPEGRFVTGHVGAVDCHWLNDKTGSAIRCPDAPSP